MSQDADLKSAIETRLFTVTGIPDAAHRKLENKLGDTPAGEPWIRVTHRFGNERIRTLPAAGARLEVIGFTQIDHFIQLGTSTAGQDTLLQAIKSMFPPQLALAVGGKTLRIRESRRWGGRRDSTWWWDHVDIYWQLWAANPLI